MPVGSFAIEAASVVVLALIEADACSSRYRSKWNGSTLT
jgi:hypothetical protein